MGAHKYNPTAIAAKNGELPPKPPKPSKREVERELYAKCVEIMCKPFIQAYRDMSINIPGIDTTSPVTKKRNAHNET